MFLAYSHANIIALKDASEIIITDVTVENLLRDDFLGHRL